jgi:hypothetical protein
MLQDTHIPVGTRVRLRPVHDFLTLRSAEATVLGPGESPGLLRIRLDLPARCHFEDDDIHEVQEMSEALDNLDIVGV